jgi:pimeloyl-ACP methyl ester carboxylesterase
MKLGQKIAINYIRARLNLLAVLSKKRAAAKAFVIFCTPFRKSKKPMPPVFDKADKLSTIVGDVTIHGYRWNRGGEKKVLILHGFESSAGNFDRYIQPLTEKNYEVLAFDAPAHGTSGGKRITLPMYIDTIRTVYFEFGPIQSFMAHSFGGLAVTHFLEKIPHDPSMRLALIAPATETTTAIDSFFRFLQLGKGVRKEFDVLVERLGGVAPSWYSIPRALTNIKATILWVHDKDDDVTPLSDVQPIIDKNHPNIQFLVTEGWGHRKIYRENKVVRAIIDFL